MLYLIPLPDFIAVPLGEIVCRTWWLHTQAEKGQNKTILSTQVSDYSVLIKTLPKALRTQGLTTLTSCFGEISLVGSVW